MSKSSRYRYHCNKCGQAFFGFVLGFLRFALSLRQVAEISRRVLVVDEEFVRAFAECALTDAGYEVGGAADGLEALRLVDEQPRPFDPFVIDLGHGTSPQFVRPERDFDFLE